MKHNCTVFIVNKQIVQGRPNNVKLVTLGNYKKNKKECVLTYREHQSGDVGSDILCSLSVIKPGHITLARMGDVNSLMILEKGKHHSCQYATEFGSFVLGVYTQEIECDLKSTSGCMYIKYYMDINSSLSTKNEIFLNIKSSEEDIKQ